MKTTTIVEQPILSYYSKANTECGGCNLNCEPANIEIYSNDIRTAKVGESWATEDFDRCPNCQQRWDVSFTVVYKQDDGAAILFKNDDPDGETIELIWVELK